MIFNIVVFPEPEGPKIAANSLLRKLIETSSNAVCTKFPVLYVFLILLSFSIIFTPLIFNET